MHLEFGSSEKLKARRERDFLSMSPSERFWLFVQGIPYHNSFKKAVEHKQKENFVIHKSPSWNNSSINK